ncbi:MAG: c-type cytochrome [Pseudomonadota bacterium]
MKKLTQLLTSTVLVLGLGVSAFAEGNAENGKILAYTCLGCHGIDGYRNAYPSYRVPKLKGQSQAYLQAALKAYRSGERTHSTMAAQAASLSDQDMADLAAYFSKDGEVQAPASKGPAPEQAALCTACHGDTGKGAAPDWPTLSGQHEEYLIDSLLQYQTKTVSSRSNAVMVGLVGTLSLADIKTLARYYASFDGLSTNKEE